MSLGSMITKARKDAGLSIDDLSAATNIRGPLLREILGNASHDTWWMFIAGYVFMWSSFALVGSGLQIALSQTELLSDHGTLASRSLTAGVLALAGVYQFTPIKRYAIICNYCIFMRSSSRSPKFLCFSCAIFYNFICFRINFY